MSDIPRNILPDGPLGASFARTVLHPTTAAIFRIRLVAARLLQVPNQQSAPLTRADRQ